MADEGGICTLIYLIVLFVEGKPAIESTDEKDQLEKEICQNENCISTDVTWICKGCHRFLCRKLVYARKI